MNNNIIPACIIGAGLFAVALKPAPQPTPIPQAEPVAVAASSVTEPVIVWYGSASSSSNTYTGIFRAWSDGTLEYLQVNSYNTCSPGTGCGWMMVSSPQMACRTDINGNGEIEFSDLLAVLNQWGDQATCPDTVQLQCGLGLPNG